MLKKQVELPNLYFRTTHCLIIKTRIAAPSCLFWTPSCVSRPLINYLGNAKIDQTDRTSILLLSNWLYFQYFPRWNQYSFMSTWEGLKMCAKFINGLKWTQEQKMYSRISKLLLSYPDEFFLCYRDFSNRRRITLSSLKIWNFAVCKY